MMKISNLLMLLGTVIVLFSCENNTDLEKTPQSQQQSNSVDVSLENGKLVFKDKDAFKRVLTTLLTYSSSDLKNWENKLGHNSLRTYYNKLNESETISVDSLFENGKLLFVPDPVYSTILNKDGKYQIGEDLHKVEQTEELVINYRQEDDMVNNPNLQRLPITFGLKNLSGEKNQRTSHFIGWKDDHMYGFPDKDGRDTRAKCSAWNVTYPDFATAGIRTKFQKNSRFAGWLETNAEYVSVLGKSRTRRFPNSWQEVEISRSETNSSQVEIVLHTALGPFPVIEIDYIQGLHVVRHRGVELGRLTNN